MATPCLCQSGFDLAQLAAELEVNLVAEHLGGGDVGARDAGSAARAAAARRSARANRPVARCLTASGVPSATIAPVMQQRDPVAAFRFVHVRRAEKHRRAALFDDAADDLPELLPRDRIDAGRRLVEQENVGEMNQRADERQLLPHAARQIHGAPIEKRLKPRGRQQLRAILPVDVGGQLAEIAKELDVLVRRSGCRRGCSRAPAACSRPVV